MNPENNEYLNFNASHIISVELKSEIASNCKLRSKFVHEKLVETKNSLSGNPLLLKLSSKGLRFLNADSETLIMAHSIQHISYTACDRSSCQFALVARSSSDGAAPNSNSQFCHVLRLCSAEEADAINRYIGALFKDLNQKRRTRRSDASSKSQSQTAQSTGPPEPPELEPVTEPVATGAVSVTETGPTRLRPRPMNAYDDLDTRLKRISTPHIDELVSEKHLVRRLSLCIPSPGVDEPGGPPSFHTPASTHSSLDKHHIAPLGLGLAGGGGVGVGPSGPFERPLLRKKSDHKPNKITAVIERLSFRASRDLTCPDLLKSGSPVVALKEQLESWENAGAGPPLKRAGGTVPSDSVRMSVTGCSPWRMGGASAGQSRKNSMPMPLEQNTDAIERDSETPPVPPVRINSLRTALPFRPGAPGDDSLHGASAPVMSAFTSHAGAAAIPISMMNHHHGSRSNSDDHLSSITTPSSCGNSLTDDSRGIEMAALPRHSRGSHGHQPQGRMNFSASFNNSSQSRSFSQHSTGGENSHNSSLPLNYFRNLSKDDTTEYLINKEMGSFILRHSASHQGCFALSVKVSDTSISHYIIQSSSSTGGPPSTGYQIKGLDKTWPSLASLITHLSVIQEILPCPLFIGPHLAAPSEQHAPVPTPLATTGIWTTHTPVAKRTGGLPQSRSTEEEYQHRMRQFLNDSTSLSLATVPVAIHSGGGGGDGGPHEQYQQLSDFSSIVAGYELN